MKREHNLLERLDIRLRRAEAGTDNRWLRRLLRGGRLGLRVVLDLTDGQLTLHAMSLVYTTLLAIVPLLALSFSVLKGLGVHNQLKTVLLQFLQPMGEKGQAIAERIIDFVENVDVGVLSSVGVVLLLYSAVSLIQKVEAAFSWIWQLRKGRSLLRRFSDYLSVLVVGPVLVFAAFGLSASLMSHQLVQSVLDVGFLNSVYQFIARWIPYLLVIAAFTFVYIFIPNTRVSFRAALLGGIVSGIVWQTASWLFATFVVASVRYTAVYSGFAILLLFMIWLYLNWVILLMGASLVFYLQYPDNLDTAEDESRLSIEESERLALAVLLIIGRLFYARRQGASHAALLEATAAPARVLGPLLETLKEARLIGETETDHEVIYQPTVPLDDTSLEAALTEIRAVGGQRRRPIKADLSGLDEALERAGRSREEQLSSITLRELIG